MFKKKLQESCKPNPEREKLNQTLDETDKALGNALERLRERLREREERSNQAHRFARSAVGG